MPEKDPQFLSFFHTTLALAMFLFGGALRCTQKIIEGKEFKFGEFVFELISSLFVGIIFYLLARGLGALSSLPLGFPRPCLILERKPCQLSTNSLRKRTCNGFQNDF